MKLGLYSITYLGVWYRGDALTLEQVIDRAREYGYDGVEIDGKRPHGNPLDLSAARRLDLRRRAEAAGVEIYAVAANNDFSSPVPEHREAQLAYVNDLISLTADLGAPILRMFAAWPGVTFEPLHCVLRGHATLRLPRPWADTTSRAASGPRPTRACRRSRRGRGVATGSIESARRAADQGVMLALQNHPPVVDNGDDMLRMVREVGSPLVAGVLRRAARATPGRRRHARGVARRRIAQVLSHFGGEYDRRRRRSGARLRARARRQPDPRIASMPSSPAAWRRSDTTATSGTSSATHCRWSTAGRSGSSSPT